MIMDLHTHTHHSPDAQDTVAERVEKANTLGLRIMAITDHCELNHYYPAAYYGETPSARVMHNGRQTFEGSVEETLAMQSRCGDLLLLCGTELGQIPQEPMIAKTLYEDPRIDFAIGSIHELPGMEDFYFLDYPSLCIRDLITQYFDEVLRVAQSDFYDVLAHLTYGLRYLPDRAGYDLTPHLPVIEEIFRAVIAKDKALEFNGSGLKAELQYTDPDLFLLRKYRELGGKRITLSTDTHAKEYLAYRMNDLEQLARELGFTHVTYYQKHKPVEIPL